MTYACRTEFKPASLWQVMNDLNHRFVEGSNKSPESPTWVPAVDVTETPAAFVLYADLPGLKREDFELIITGDTLTLKGARKTGSEPESGNYRCAERRRGSFERTFRFAEKFETDKVEAKFEDGVLAVTLPKPAQSQPRKVEVTVN